MISLEWIPCKTQNPPDWQRTVVRPVRHRELWYTELVLAMGRSEAQVSIALKSKQMSRSANGDHCKGWDVERKRLGD